jgi:hypothetical protein
MATNNLLRALAAIFDFILCIPLHLLLGQNEVYREWSLGLFDFLSVHVNLPWSVLTIFPAIICIFIILVFYRLFCQLILNRSFGQALLGLELNVSGIKGRMLGLLYVLASVILWPINLVLESLDLFSLSKFFSGVEQKEVDEISTARVLLMITFSILFIAISIALPVTLQLKQSVVVYDDRDSIKVSSQIDEILKQKKVIADEQTIFFTSNRMKLMSSMRLDDQRFIVLPDFDFYKVKKSIKFEPVIQIVESETNSKGTIKIHGTVDIMKMLKSAFVGDPLSSLVYEKLHGEVFSKKPYGQKVWSRDDSTIGVMHPLVVEDKIELLKYILEFDMLKRPLQSISNGPFTSGRLSLRAHIRKLMKMDQSSKVLIETHGNYKFLVSRILEPKGIREYWLPLGTRYPLLLEFEWQGNNNAQGFLEEFKLAFFKNAFWFFDYQSLGRFPELEADMTVFNIFDELTTREIDVNKVDLLEEYIYRFFYNTCRAELFLNGAQRRGYIKRSLERTSKIITMRGQYRKTFSSFFLGQMESLVKAYTNKDRKYFNL